MDLLYRKAPARKKRDIVKDQKGIKEKKIKGKKEKKKRGGIEKDKKKKPNKLPVPFFTV